MKLIISTRARVEPVLQRDTSSCYRGSVTNSLPDYRNLDVSGEASLAAGRMEARAQEPASQAMFDALVRPYLGERIRSVLDLGCGTASLARRIATVLPQAEVFGLDKSEGMLKVAGHLANQEGLSRITLNPWDVTKEAEFPLRPGTFDLIISSVLIIYLSDAEVSDLVTRLVKRLNSGGILMFLEQDLMTDSLDDSSGLFLKVLEKDKRVIQPSQGLGVRKALKGAGLEPLPLASHVWSDERYGPYVHELLERFADAAASKGVVSEAESNTFKEMLNVRAQNGEFYYGLVYHRIAGRKR